MNIVREKKKWYTQANECNPIKETSIYIIGKLFPFWVLGMGLPFIGFNHRESNFLMFNLGSIE